MFLNDYLFLHLHPKHLHEKVMVSHHDVLKIRPNKEQENVKQYKLPKKWDISPINQKKNLLKNTKKWKNKHFCNRAGQLTFYDSIVSCKCVLHADWEVLPYLAVQLRLLFVTTCVYTTFGIVPVTSHFVWFLPHLIYYFFSIFFV